MTLNLSCGSLTFIALGTPSASANVCSGDTFELEGVIDRGKHAAGDTFTPTNTDTFFFLQSTLGVVRECSSWTGTVCIGSA